MNCVTCDSRTDPNCLVPNNNTKTEQCVDPNSKCYTYAVRSMCKRGCSDDGYYNPLQSETKFEECSNPLCNNFAIENTCIHCLSDYELECRSNPGSLEKKICSLNAPSQSNHSACFVEKMKGDWLRRGCVNDLRNDKQKNCLDSASNCEICFGQNCNQKTNSEQKCYSCDGTVDANCKIFDSNIKIIQCSNYSSSCLTGMDSEGYIHRGCSSNPENDRIRYAKGFDLCFDEKCNNQHYPFTRLSCYQCVNSFNCNFGWGPLYYMATPCKNHSKEPQCFAYSDPGKSLFSN